MQADSSLEESKTVSEPPKSRPDYTLAVRRGELRFKNHHPDPRTSRYGQRLVEEILGCRMSGWLTPKLECNKKLQAIPPPSHPPRGYHGPFGAGAAPVRYRAVRALVGLDMRRNLRYFTPVFSVAFEGVWGGQLENLKIEKCQNF